MQEISGAQVGDRVGPAPFVDEQRKSDARLFAENSCIVPVAQANGGQRSTPIPEGLLVFAQLRDVLAAKYSAIMAQKNDNGRLVLPQRTQTDFSATHVGENDVCELLAQSFLHAGNHHRRVAFACQRFRVAPPLGGWEDSASTSG
jgi:hypothetical protein